MQSLNVARQHLNPSKTFHIILLSYILFLCTVLLFHYTHIFYTSICISLSCLISPHLSHQLLVFQFPHSLGQVLNHLSQFFHVILQRLHILYVKQRDSKINTK